MTRWKACLPLIALVLFLMVSPVLAGGWSVTTLDDLPEHTIAGEPVPVGFVVRQHGVRVLFGLTPVISAVHEQSGDTVEFGATEDMPGHHLTDFGASADYLTAWLDNPAAVKPSTVMPALRLDKAEIEALIAFLNAEETQAARAERFTGLLRSLRGWWYWQGAAQGHTSEVTVDFASLIAHSPSAGSIRAVDRRQPLPGEQVDA